MKQKIGLKLHTSNVTMIPSVEKCIEKQVFDFIELYVEPESMNISNWAKLAIPFVIHAPHFGNGVNLARKELRNYNFKAYKTTKIYADVLKSEIIIAHGGNNGPEEEAAKQLRRVDDGRIHLENKPYMGLNNAICIGARPEELKRIIDYAGLSGFVLDFGHAVNSAVSLNVSYLDHIEAFLDMKPVHFHISDGDIESEKDIHLNLGSGNFPIKTFIAMAGNNAKITLETPRLSEIGLEDSINDLFFIKRLFLHDDK